MRNRNTLCALSHCDHKRLLTLCCQESLKVPAPGRGQGYGEKNR